MQYQIKLAHLYPERLNLYGDYGNILALKRLAQFYGIDLVYHTILLGNEVCLEDYDFFFMGGGQDHEQGALMEDFLHQKGPHLIRIFEENKIFLGICGAFQLLGRSFITQNKKHIQGLSYFPMVTEGKAERLISNVVTRLNDSILQEFPPHQKSDALLFGFENHSGQTFLEQENLKPLAYVLNGTGNATQLGVEGAYKNHVFGTYLHGSFLPKNPFFTKYLLHLALKKKYNIHYFELLKQTRPHLLEEEKQFFETEEALRKDLAKKFLNKEQFQAYYQE